MNHKPLKKQHLLSRNFGLPRPGTSRSKSWPSHLEYTTSTARGRGSNLIYEPSMQKMFVRWPENFTQKKRRSRAQSNNRSFSGARVLLPWKHFLPPGDVLRLLSNGLISPVSPRIVKCKEETLYFWWFSRLLLWSHTHQSWTKVLLLLFKL